MIARTMNPLHERMADQASRRRLRADARPFEPGEKFYTLLFREGEGFRREDLSEEAWQQRNENIRPFSFWKTRYEPPPAGAAGTARQRKTPRRLFRRLLAANEASHANACYVLAVMLERKRVLKQIKTDERQTGRVLIYEHAKTGDVFIVPDPQLRLDELAAVQTKSICRQRPKP